MKPALPHAGLVIRYAYLWSREAALGRDEGVKDRPCAVLLAAQTRDGRTAVTVLPVTHTLPTDPAHAVEIPAKVKRRLGLDGDRSWIVLTEVNQFFWPGPDLRPVAGDESGGVAYGELPGDLYRQVRDRWLTLYDRGLMKQVARTE